MVLVDYPSSGSDDEEDGDETTNLDCHVKIVSQGQTPEGLSTKRKADQAGDTNPPPRSKLPPLPTSFHSLYAFSVRKSASDDPTLHGGRKRQVPHVQGNWPSHVYLEWFPGLLQRDHIAELISQAQSHLLDHPAVNTFLSSSLGVQQSLHISLSAPLVLTTAVKDDFQLALVASVHAAKISSFHITPESLDWVSNFEGSRYFLILRLGVPQGNSLNRLLSICNDVCKQFDLPLLYQTAARVGIERLSKSSRDDESPKVKDGSHAFHISVAWTLDEPTETAKSAVRLTDLGSLLQEQISVTEVKVKVGNTIENVRLEKS